MGRIGLRYPRNIAIFFTSFTRISELQKGEMNMIEKLENRKGFTLIRVTVLGVIVLILTALVTPFYNDFIHNTHQKAIDNLAQTAAEAANTYWRKTGATPTLDQLNFFYDNDTYTIAIHGSNITVTHKTRTTLTQTVPYTN